MARRARLLAFLGLAIFGLGCNTGVSTPTAVILPASSVPVLITVNGTTLAVGTTAQFIAVATMTDGTTKDVTTLATWQSSNPQSAIVSPTGLVRAYTPGNLSISATYQNVSGSFLVAVTP